MPELFLDGPDALRLLERLGINTVKNSTADRAKQVVACTPAAGPTTASSSTAPGWQDLRRGHRRRD
jgi:hypothetical protein